MRYTVVYSDFFSRGSHTHSLVKILRIDAPSAEAVGMVLGGYGVEMSQVNYIFEGWPKLEGEPTEPEESPR